MEIFYNYQVRASVLLSEAHHFFAWQQSGDQATSLHDPNALVNICGPEALGSAKVNCLHAQEGVESTCVNVLAQFEIVGAPYANNDVIVQYATTNGEHSQATMYPRSLEAITHANGGEGCPSVLTSEAPCGFTVANRTKYSYPSLIEFRGYQGWSPSQKDDWVLLFNGLGIEQPSAFFGTLGL